MELEDCLKNLGVALQGEFSPKAIEASSPLIFELHNLFGLDYEDVMHICLKFSEIFHLNQFELVNNLGDLAKTFNLKSLEMKHLFLKEPWLLKLKSPVFKHKIDLLSLTFAVSSKEALKLLYHYPELARLTKESVKEQIELISIQFDEYGLGVRKQFRREPRLLFAKKADILRVKRFLMHNFTLSESEVCRIFRTAPEVVLFPTKKLSELFGYLYPALFIKRDLKEMFAACPELFCLEKKDFSRKIDEITHTLSVDQKTACKMIRTKPSILFFDISSKLASYQKVGINIKYLAENPSLCMLPEVTVPLRLVITKIFSLEKHFDKLCKIDLGLLISRMMFMQAYNQFSHADLLLSSDEFAKKYNISTKVLLVSYRMDRQALENLISYYVNLKGKSSAIDLAFPNEQEILDLINSKVETEPASARLANLPNNKRELFLALLGMQLSTNEINYVLRRNPSLCLFAASSTVANIKLFRKLGLSKENIMMLLLNHPTLFSYSFRDLDLILKAGQENDQSFEETIEMIL